MRNLVMISLVLALTTAAGMTSSTAPSLDAPTSVSGGASFTVSGVSVSGQAGTDIDVMDGDGDLTFTVTWDGNKYSATITAPAFTPEFINDIKVTVTGARPVGRTSATVRVVR